MPVVVTVSPICRRLAAVRKSGELKWLRPDGKSQVTVEYDPDHRHHAGGSYRLAGNAPVGILGQDSVQDSIGDLVVDILRDPSYNNPGLQPDTTTYLIKSGGGNGISSPLYIFVIIGRINSHALSLF